MDRAVAFQPFGSSDGDLRGKAEPAEVNRCADHGGKSCVDEVPTAYHGKHALLLGVLPRLPHEVDVAACVSWLDLIRQNVLHLVIEPIGVPIMISRSRSPLCSISDPSGKK
jgi:hypothetical protein